jgi:hypothetical protein
MFAAVAAASEVAGVEEDGGAPLQVAGVEEDGGALLQVTSVEEDGGALLQVAVVPTMRLGRATVEDPARPGDVVAVVKERMVARPA